MNASRDGRGRSGIGTAVVLAVVLAAMMAGACWRIGEPTPSAALVTWAAYPETVRAGATFSFEFAGPVAPDACGRLDTAILTLGPTAIELSARRSTYEGLCGKQRVSFYEARPLVIDRPGLYAIRTAERLDLGQIVVTDTGPSSRMVAIGDGTVRGAGGCLLFGPGWASNQRPFALRGWPAEIETEAGTDRVVHVEGRLIGFSLCGRYGSRPTIRVDTAWVTARRGSDYY